jgi:hypothetical protein
MTTGQGIMRPGTSKNGRLIYAQANAFAAGGQPALLVPVVYSGAEHKRENGPGLSRGRLSVI